VGLQYHRWNICEAARKRGEKEGVELYRFLKEALVRRFGEKWYDELCVAAEMIKNYDKKQ
jgi:hypothetical protein